MLNSNYIIYFVKEYFAIIFYLLIIFNIVIRVIVTKKNKKKKKKKKSRKGGGILGDILYILLCIITFGWSCNFWGERRERRERSETKNYFKKNVLSEIPNRALEILIGVDENGEWRGHTSSKKYRLAVPSSIYHPDFETTFN
jgi:hypothetical protein